MSLIHVTNVITISVKKIERIQREVNYIGIEYICCEDIKGYQTFFYPNQQTSYNVCWLKPILRYVRDEIEFSSINVISNTLTSPRKRRVSLFLRASPLIGPATHFYWRIIPMFVLPCQVF